MAEPPQQGASRSPRGDTPRETSEGTGGEQDRERDAERGLDHADGGEGERDGAFVGDAETADERELPLEEIVADRPLEAVEPLRGPLAFAGTGVAGFLMGTAEVVPGFSGGTVALVVGIYERLIANVRQGARTLSLLVRGHPNGAFRALLAIEWPFVATLLVGMMAAVFSVAATLRVLIDEQPTLLKAALFGLVLGAAIIASRELRAATIWHVLLGTVVAFGVFFGLGATGGIFLEASVWTILFGGAIAVCAWILPGISGSFILLLLGLYTAVVDAVADRNIGLLLVLAIGCVAGLAAFSTLLNWLLARFHDLVLAALIGLMVGSVRVLWPYPSDAPFENVELGAPEGTASLLTLAVGLTAFSLVWMLGLLATAIARRRRRRAARRAEERAVRASEESVVFDDPPAAEDGHPDPADGPRPPRR